MKFGKLDQMIKGWFIGNFDPTMGASEHVEVGVKFYKAGDIDQPHFHKIATEITCIIEGQVEMCGQILGNGDIIEVESGEANTFKALKDTTLVVVKLPCAKDDKYLLEEDLSS